MQHAGFLLIVDRVSASFYSYAKDDIQQKCICSRIKYHQCIANAKIVLLYFSKLFHVFRFICNQIKVFITQITSVNSLRAYGYSISLEFYTNDVFIGSESYRASQMGILL